MNLLFIDFAETIGFRTIPEIKTDFKIISDLVNDNPLSLGDYENYQKIENYYDRNLVFPNLSAEKEYTQKYFYKYLSSIGLVSGKLKPVSEAITEKKFTTLFHRLFDDVIPFLERVHTKYDTYILSDGRPSRALVFKNLGLDNYCKDFFISSNIGFEKSQLQFYECIFDKIGRYENIVFIDDRLENLDTLSSFCDINGIYLDRRNTEPNYSGSYTHISKLPTNL